MISLTSSFSASKLYSGLNDDFNDVGKVGHYVVVKLVRIQGLVKVGRID